VNGAEDVSEESPTEGQQDSIEPNIDLELQIISNQESSRQTTAVNINTAEFLHLLPLQNNIDPALVDVHEPRNTPWNLEAQGVELDNGSRLSTQQEDIHNFEQIDILAGLFDVSQDPFLSNMEWYGALNQQTSPDHSVDMAHPGWHLQDYSQFNDPPSELPRLGGPAKSIKQVETLPVILERPQEKPVAEFASGDLRATILDDLQKYLSPEELRDLDLPRTRVLQKCLRSYIRSFHCHFPILHITQILGCDTPSPLRLAICSIGALYLMDRKNATLFRNLGYEAIRTVSMHAHV